ncbi:hypothetical protein [Streptomyces sp. NPDC052042]|uniref:hypothetical protein n=1 Tax=Streptomyces sp. NPDC052042 TaxID=3365683 RepID=UPI0037D683D0
MSEATAVDLRTLSMPVSRGEWKRFCAEARAGHHGPDLADASYIMRYGATLYTVMHLSLIAAVIGPLALSGELRHLREEGGILYLGGILVWIAAWTLVGVLLRPHSWWVRARARYRLHRFVTANGIRHEAEAPLGRRPGVVFEGTGVHRRHRDWCVVPGPTGFEIANYHAEDADASQNDMHWSEDWGYAVFALRGSYPRTLVSDRLSRPWPPKKLEKAEPVPLPGAHRLRMRSTKPHYPALTALLSADLLAVLEAVRPVPVVEIVGDELHLYARGSFDFALPGTWRTVLGIRDVLAPHLSCPANVTDLAHRTRTGEVRELER